jgi:hypothetical protein
MPEAMLRPLCACGARNGGVPRRLCAAVSTLRSMTVCGGVIA